MKKLLLNLLILTHILFFFSCQNENNKSVTIQLSTKDVNSLIESDILYERIIRDVESVRKIFDNDIVTKSKFQKLSYKDYYEYYKIVNSNEFNNRIREKSIKTYQSFKDSIIGVYKSVIDEKFKKLKEKEEIYNLNNYFNIEFVDIEGEFINRYFQFKINPLRNSIQGGKFRYIIYETDTGLEALRFIRSFDEQITASRDCTCSFLTSISSPTTFKWKVPRVVWINITDFENNTPSEMKSKYYFKFKILEVVVNNNTINGWNFKYLFSDVSDEYRNAFENKRELSVEDYMNIISKEYDSVAGLDNFQIEINLNSVKEKTRINRIARELEYLIEYGQ